MCRFPTNGTTRTRYYRSWAHSQWAKGSCYRYLTEGITTQEPQPGWMKTDKSNSWSAESWRISALWRSWPSRLCRWRIEEPHWGQNSLVGWPGCRSRRAWRLVGLCWWWCGREWDYGKGSIGCWSCWRSCGWRILLAMSRGLLWLWCCWLERFRCCQRAWLFESCGAV